MRKESTNYRNGFLMEKPCLLLTECTRKISYWEETTSFYRVNAMLLIGETRREKQKTITRRHCNYEK
jgi:hypothetical protein